MLTDGVIETLNLSGQQFGINGVSKIIQELGPTHSINNLIKEILKRQHDFSEGRLIRDDVTLVGLERL